MRSASTVEVLRQLKADEETKQIPVVMLTTTDDPREIARCYRLGCSVYPTKPVECAGQASHKRPETSLIPEEALVHGIAATAYWEVSSLRERGHTPSTHCTAR